MNSRLLQISVLATTAALLSCEKKPDASVETDALKRRVEQLEQEKLAAAEQEKATTEEELARSQAQLQLALQELEKERAGAAAKPAPVVEEAPRAVVVDEAPRTDPKVAVKAAEGQDYRIFFRELSRTGDWFGTDGYGYVWQPREARTARGWQPYTRGRWVHSAQGWTWASDEEFGWATYHYGRWAQLETHGWAWIPGDEWAPAWVSWRQSDEFIGWAPLPPESMFGAAQRYDSRVDTIYDLAPSSYAFVPVSRFAEPVAAHRVPRAEVMRIMVGTRNVTQIETRQGAVYCGGPDPAWLANRLGAEVPHRTVRRESQRFDGPEQQRWRGNDLELYAPRVQAPWNPAVRPQQVTKAWGNVSSVRGDGAMDRGALDRYRAELLARQEEARRALELEAVRAALTRDRLAREEAERQAEAERRRGTACQPGEHERLENAYVAAMRDEQAATAAVTAPNQNPKQVAFARMRLANATQKLAAAERGYLDHLGKYHPDDHRRFLAERERAHAEEAHARAEEQQRGDALANERVQREGEEARREAQAQAQAEAVRRAAMEAEARALREAAEGTRRQAEERAMREQAKAEAERLAKEEQRKLDAARLDAERAMAAEKARAEADALAEAKQLALEEQRRQAAQARLEAERAMAAEKARAEAEARAEAKQLALEEQRRQAAQARLEAERAMEAEKARAEAEAVAEAKQLALEEQRAQARLEAERAMAAERARVEAERAAKEAVEPSGAQDPAVCSAEVHQQLEEVLAAATAATVAAQQKLESGNLNPKQAAFARKILGDAVRKEGAAQGVFDVHLQEFHPAEWKQVEAERAAALKREKGGRKDKDREKEAKE